MNESGTARLVPAVVLTLATVAVAAAAGAAGWDVLGERSVDLHADTDTIRVTASEGRFDAIKLQVRKNGIEIKDLKVVFGDGGVHDVRLASFIERGASTRVIDLPGGARVIAEVRLVYRSRAPGAGRARVRLLGRQAGGHAHEADPAASWERLGARSVDFRVDRDTIPVTATEGTFRTIRLKVHGNGLRVIDLKVHFGDGGVQDVHLATFIRPGGSSRVIDLDGGHRVVRKVELVYSTRGPRGRKATVEVWGRA